MLHNKQENQGEGLPRTSCERKKTKRSASKCREGCIRSEEYWLKGNIGKDSQQVTSTRSVNPPWGELKNKTCYF